MISRQAKKLVLARERLQTLTPAELTEVSGGGRPHHGPHHEKRHEKKRHEKKHHEKRRFR